MDSKPLRAEPNTLLLGKSPELAFIVCLRVAILTTLWGRYSRPHFTDGDTETQRSWEAPSGSLRGTAMLNWAAWFLLSWIPESTHSPGQSQCSMGGHGEQGPKSSSFWGPLLALGYLLAGRPLYSPSPAPTSSLWLPAKLQPVHPPTMRLAKAPPGVCIWIEAPACKQTMRPVRDGGGLNPARSCSPFFTSHPKAEGGSPLTQQAYFSTCCIIDSASLPLIRGPPLILRTVQFSSVAQSCPTLCDPMDSSTPGLPVHHQHPELAQTHVHRVGGAIQPFHPLLSPSPPTFSLSQHQGLFNEHRKGSYWHRLGSPTSSAQCHEGSRQLQPALSSQLPPHRRALEGLLVTWLQG